MSGFDWYSRPELNRDQRFRKPLLYPFELREPSCVPSIIVQARQLREKRGRASRPVCSLNHNHNPRIFIFILTSHIFRSIRLNLPRVST